MPGAGGAPENPQGGRLAVQHTPRWLAGMLDPGERRAPPSFMGLVGRDDELRAVAGVLHGLEELPRAVVLSGEAGIGKTSLWSAGLDAAEARGYRVLRTRPAEAETGFAFAGLTDLLEGAAADVLPDLPSLQRRAIETALLLRESEVAVDERAVASAFLGALRILAREAPVLVAVDDLQWLDSATLATVRFALARLDVECVAALFAVRGPTPEWLRRGMPEHRLVTVEVGRLSLGATSRLLHERVTTRFSRPVTVRIHEVAGGNPFYALELARALQRRGGTLDPAGELPLSETLAELVALRLDGLTPAALLAARVAASAADPTVAHIEAVLGAEAEAALAACLAARVLELDGSRVRLVHPLLGSAIRSKSTPAELRAVHLRLAGLTVTEEQRARHLALSTREADEGIATVLDQEAASALRRGATATAAELAELAVRMTPPGDPTATRRRVLVLADRLSEVGDYERATALLEQALADAPPGGSRGRVLWRLAGIRDSTTGPHEAQELYRQALAEASDDPGLQAEVLLKLAELARFTSDRDTGFGACTQSRDDLDRDRRPDEPMPCAGDLRPDALLGRARNCDRGDGGSAGARALTPRQDASDGGPHLPTVLVGSRGRRARAPAGTVGVGHRPRRPRLHGRATGSSHSSSGGQATGSSPRTMRTSWRRSGTRPARNGCGRSTSIPARSSPPIEGSSTTLARAPSVRSPPPRRQGRPCTRQCTTPCWGSSSCRKVMP